MCVKEDRSGDSTCSAETLAAGSLDCSGGERLRGYGHSSYIRTSPIRFLIQFSKSGCHVLSAIDPDGTIFDLHFIGDVS